MKGWSGRIIEFLVNSNWIGGKEYAVNGFGILTHP
jgi:hypothetical protein